jgi:CDGSH-type Zn-finger protein
MAEVTIRPLKNGPYQVSGGARLLDFEGGSYRLDDDPIYLCRCGRSASKPFCDGMHKTVGFQAEECVRVTPGR